MIAEIKHEVYKWRFWYFATQE